MPRTHNTLYDCLSSVPSLQDAYLGSEHSSVVRTGSLLFEDVVFPSLPQYTMLVSVPFLFLLALGSLPILLPLFCRVIFFLFSAQGEFSPACRALVTRDFYARLALWRGAETSSFCVGSSCIFVKISRRRLAAF